eukprot:15350198-Ditylum_brightwellii.AAC.1
MDNMQPQTFRKVIYFPCHLTISVNASKCDFEDGNLAEQEIKKLRTSHGGGGINLKMSSNHSH